jgi:hypothetical protein
VLYAATPIMEGIAGIYTPASFFAINATMTTTHGLWAVIHFVNSFSVFHFGNKVSKMLASSIKFHKDSALKDTPLILELKKALRSVKISTFILPNMTGFGMVMCVILCVGRYYVWSSQQWSLLIMFGCFWAPGLCSVALCAIMFARYQSIPLPDFTVLTQNICFLLLFFYCFCFCFPDSGTYIRDKSRELLVTMEVEEVGEAMAPTDQLRTQPSLKIQ